MITERKIDKIREYIHTEHNGLASILVLEVVEDILTYRPIQTDSFYIADGVVNTLAALIMTLLETEEKGFDFNKPSFKENLLVLIGYIKRLEGEEVDMIFNMASEDTKELFEIYFLSSSENKEIIINNILKVLSD